MSIDPFETLSAFVDGEAIDPAALAGALAAPGAREALIDFVRLRGVVAADPAVPSAEFYAGMERLMRGSSSPRHSWWPRRIAAGVAASVLFAIGIVVGLEIRGRTGPVSAIESPPTPTREVRFTEGVDWFQG